ncbi:MAG: hypothetical protein ACLFR1_03750 [Spirochaetia bacterium]
MHRISAVVFTLILVLPIISYSQSKQEGEDALNQRLRVSISVRVLHPSLEEPWSMVSENYTISGRAVTVRLFNENLRVLAQFTPYVQNNDTILLVAQGQVWILTHGQERVKYRSVLRTLPIPMGEEILFFPIGTIQSTQNAQTIIELAILIEQEKEDSQGS